jgi:DNA-binding beta-propeller fold protein YncE
VFALIMASVALRGCGARTRTRRRGTSRSRSALDRVSFFDLDRREVVGVLPTQKLPHDMLATANARTLFVVNSGGQCLSAYDVGAPELWRQAREFMTRDSARVAGRPAAAAPRQLPGTIERHRLTSPLFPARAHAVHVRDSAFTRESCTDCHDRSVGERPFAPVFVRGGQAIRMVHMTSREIVEVDAATLAPLRRWPLPIPEHFTPIEAWVKPGTDTAFVTCRDSIGRGLPGTIAVVDLASGNLVRRIETGVYPWHLVPTPDGRSLIVNHFQGSRLAIVDVARQQVVDSIVVENGPAMLFVDGGRTLLVSCYTQRVLVVDFATRQVTRRIPVGSNPTSLLATREGGRVWVLCGGESELQLLDFHTGQVAERHPLLFGAYAIQLVPPRLQSR